MQEKLFDLPELIPGEQAELLLLKENKLIEHATCAMQTSEDPERITRHLDAITLANELILCHVSASQADELPHYCAEQLKLFHLAALTAL